MFGFDHTSSRRDRSDLCIVDRLKEGLFNNLYDLTPASLDVPCQGSLDVVISKIVNTGRLTVAMVVALLLVLRPPVKKAVLSGANSP
jgi:hypothetical protein